MDLAFMAYNGHPFRGSQVHRDGYKVYYNAVKLLVAVGWYRSGTEFMEAVVNEKDKTVTFFNYHDQDVEEWTTLKLRDINPPIVWRMYPEFS